MCAKLFADCFAVVYEAIGDWRAMNTSTSLTLNSVGVEYSALGTAIRQSETHSKLAHSQSSELQTRLAAVFNFLN